MQKGNTKTTHILIITIVILATIGIAIAATSPTTPQPVGHDISQINGINLLTVLQSGSNASTFLGGTEFGGQLVIRGTDPAKTTNYLTISVNDATDGGTIFYKSHANNNVAISLLDNKILLGDGYQDQICINGTDPEDCKTAWPEDSSGSTFNFTTLRPRLFVCDNGDGSLVRCRATDGEAYGYVTIKDEGGDKWGDFSCFPDTIIVSGGGWCDGGTSVGLRESRPLDNYLWRVGCENHAQNLGGVSLMCLQLQ